MLIIGLPLWLTFRHPSARSGAEGTPPPVRICSKCATTGLHGQTQSYPQDTHRLSFVKLAPGQALPDLSPKNAGPSTSGLTPPRSRSQAGRTRNIEPRLRRFRCHIRGPSDRSIEHSDAIRMPTTLAMLARYAIAGVEQTTGGHQHQNRGYLPQHHPRSLNLGHPGESSPGKHWREDQKPPRHARAPALPTA